MKRSRSILGSIQCAALLFFLLQCFSAYGAEPAVGTQLPQFTVGTPDSPEVQKYLGLKNSDPFKLSNMSAKVVLMEFFSVF